MPRLKAPFGVVVSVSEKTAVLLGSDWKPVDGPKGAGSGGKSTAEKSATPDASWTAAALKTYAAEHDIAIGKAKSKPDILAAIAASAADESDEGDGSGGDADSE